MTQPLKILWFAVFVATFLLLPCRAAAQSGTVIDDAFLSSNTSTQLLNLNGQGLVLIVAGSSATFNYQQVGATKAFIKFQLQSSLPPNVAAANVAKATLKLYLSPFTKPSGAIDIYPITSAWTESTLNPSSPPTLASTPFGTPISVGQANSFLVVDVTKLVQEWLEGSVNGGIDNDGIALVADTSATYVVFDSKENVVTSHEPRLEIVLANSGPVGPQGPQGPEGPQGQQGLTGPAGAPGAAASVQVGTTMTVPAGTPASVLNGGTANAAVLNFLIPQGPIGLTGAQGPQGPVGINNKGLWNGTVSYNPNDGVFDSASYWLATAANTNSEPSPTNPSWQLLAGGIVNRGQWNPTNSYNVYDAVSDQGSFWLALQATPANTSNSEPSSINTSWQLLAAAGAAGSQGPAGATGAAGQSVATSPESAGANCMYAGAKFVAANGTTFACNGAPGAQGPPGPAAGSGSGGFNGIQEFTTSGTFVVPAGVTHLLVEMWGAGGGGGGGGASFTVLGLVVPGGGGGAGGSGGYTRAVVPVTPSATYSIIVGTAGTGGQGASGTAGTASQILDTSSNVLATAAGGGGGGAGGAASTHSVFGGAGGAGAAGGAGGPGTNVVGRNGNSGSGGTKGSCNQAGTSCAAGVGGQGTSAPVGSISTVAGLSGSGGSGDSSSGAQPGANGTDGYVLILW